MEIKLHKVSIREIVKDYIDNEENGVVGYGGKLNIRPAYQREFVYKEKQRNAVIETVTKDFPLNVMYWVEDEKAIMNFLTDNNARLVFVNMLTAIFLLIVVLSIILPKQKRIRYWIIR